MNDLLVQGTSTAPADVLLPSNILRSLATIEADASSHAEAVLHGRLSNNTSLPPPQQLPPSNPPSTNEVEVETVVSPSKSQAQNGGSGGGRGRQIIDDFRRKVRRVIRYNFYDIYYAELQ